MLCVALRVTLRVALRVVARVVLRRPLSSATQAQRDAAFRDRKKRREAAEAAELGAMSNQQEQQEQWLTDFDGKKAGATAAVGGSNASGDVGVGAAVGGSGGAVSGGVRPVVPPLRLENPSRSPVERRRPMPRVRSKDPTVPYIRCRIVELSGGAAAGGAAGSGAATTGTGAGANAGAGAGAGDSPKWCVKVALVSAGGSGFMFRPRREVFRTEWSGVSSSIKWPKSDFETDVPLAPLLPAPKGEEAKLRDWARIEGEVAFQVCIVLLLLAEMLPLLLYVVCVLCRQVVEWDGKAEVIRGETIIGLSELVETVKDTETAAVPRRRPSSASNAKPRGSGDKAKGSDRFKGRGVDGWYAVRGRGGGAAGAPAAVGELRLRLQLQLPSDANVVSARMTSSEVTSSEVPSSGVDAPVDAPTDDADGVGGDVDATDGDAVEVPRAASRGRGQS